MSPFASLMQWWSLRTVREQRMLAVMAALIAATLVWLLIVRPLFGWRADAADRLASSRSDAAFVASAAASVPVGGSQPSQGAIDVAAVAQEAATASAVGVAFAMDESGGLGFTATNASTAALFGWLAELDRRGIRTTRLAVTENADATLQVDGALAQ